MNKIELLAPAGNMESLCAAVQNGADAVYLGGAKFSARAYASNFNEENMIKAVEYSHLYNVKIYVTVNTAIKEDEIKEALEYVEFLYKIGVDALIIQDTGLAQLINRNFPKFEIHASTQMSIHNAEGAIFLKNLGFSRIVLARELSLKEITHISRDLNIETEIFVHGALCVSYSGQCLMSSLIGGRSGNRGRCAQPCRLPYEIIDKKRKKKEKGYILSPKDVCTIENIKDIIKSGTTSLKIEGRMKRPEYVAGVVSAYRKAIDDANCDIKKEKKKLLQLFNRGGFSKAYLYGNIGRDMMSYKFPKNTGVFIGKVNKDLTIELKENIRLQDGIRFKGEGFTISKIIKDSKNVDEAFIGDRVRLNPTKYKSGDMLFKTSDNVLLNSLAKSYENVYERKNKLNLNVVFKVGEPIIIETYYNSKRYRALGEEVQVAKNKPIDKEKLVKNLSKTGDTPFEFKDIKFVEFEDGFMPVSSINSVRRQLIDDIVKDIKLKNKRNYNNDLDLKLNINKLNKKKSNNILDNTIVTVTTKEQLKATLKCGFESIAVEISLRNCDINLKNINCKNLYIKTSTIIKEEFENLCTVIEDNSNIIKGIITSNSGIINRFKGKTEIIGDYKLNIFNSYSLDFYKDILDIATISLELNKKEIKKITQKGNLRCAYMIYGKPELMVSEYCPIGCVFGGRNKNTTCNLECLKGEYVLKDRMNVEMEIRTDKYCRSHIYNASPINLIPNLDEIKSMNIDIFRLEFLSESYDETLNILESFKKEKFQEDFKNYTRGHYKRGVE
ncbi:U32 family peptidase [Clostridium niameyense]|uniref:U32 family peptidase n=1 Tax=Clostridium niameyense TaxID=1622073 RepID=UPI00067F0594|nr:U32 family peptidase [Clostridium niameyense]